MADKFYGGILAGATSVSTNFTLRAIADGTEVAGKVAADLTASYWQQGGTRTAITLTDLGSVNAAYSSGGVKEVDATNQPGLYRLDLPTGATAAGADWVVVSVKAANCFVYHERLPLWSNPLETAIKAKTDSLTFTTAGKVDATLQAAADLAQAAADKVWQTAARTLTAFGFTVNLASSVWDEVSASHNTAGTMGQKLNAAGSATDPLTSAVPGAYVAGTAGFVLGNLSSDAASIAVIKTKTDQLTFTTPNVVDASGAASASAIAAAVLNTVMTEGYAADGAPATLAQMQYMLWAAAAAEKVISGTTMTVKKLDGTSTAMVFQLNDPTNPTSITRSS